MKVNNNGKGQLFNQKWLEFFTKTNWIVHVLTYGIIVCASLFFNTQSMPITLIYIGGGAITWTLAEYIIHRFLFHIKPSKFQYLIHGIHHEFPRDEERLMMPPLPGTLIALVFFALWFIVFKENVFAFMAGFVLSYMYYTFIHFIVHAWKPVFGIKFLWSHHHKHHNPKFENFCYGVSSPLWDYVFGTMPFSKHKKSD